MQPMPTAALYRSLPHSGAMCLLDDVLDHDAGAIRCTTRSHRDGGNPLRRDGRLATVHAIEYAAQAAALHGRLRGMDADGPLLLAAVNDLHLAVADIHALSEPLWVVARVELRSGTNAVYSFELGCGDVVCASGRISLMGRRPSAP